MSLGHGRWLPWLRENEKALGFGEWASQRMMNLSKTWSTTDLSKLSPQEAIALSRELWGNKTDSRDELRKLFNAPKSAEIDSRIVAQDFRDGGDDLTARWYIEVYEHRSYLESKIAKFANLTDVSRLISGIKKQKQRERRAAVPTPESADFSDDSSPGGLCSSLP